MQTKNTLLTANWSSFPLLKVALLSPFSNIGPVLPFTPYTVMVTWESVAAAASSLVTMETCHLPSAKSKITSCTFKMQHRNDLKSVFLMFWQRSTGTCFLHHYTLKIVALKIFRSDFSTPVLPISWGLQIIFEQK